MKHTTPTALNWLVAGSTANIRHNVAQRLQQACHGLGLPPPSVQELDAQNTLQFMTCARTAQVLVLPADAAQGLLPQHLRLVYLASLMGVGHIALAVGYGVPRPGDAENFAQIQQTFEQFSQPLGFKNTTTLMDCAIPSPWHSGLTWDAFVQTVAHAESSQGRDSTPQAALETADQFEATLVWLHDEAGLVGRSYAIQMDAQQASASLTSIKHRVNTNTLAQEAATHLAHNGISVCNLATSKALTFKTDFRAASSFLLHDRVTKDTVAMGVVRHSLRRAHNVLTQVHTITRQNREKLNGHRGRVIWFTGLSGSGKSTLANALEVALNARGQRTYLLDGDNVRQGLNKDLGFTDADRVENIRRIAEVAKLMMDAGLVVMTAFISPFRRERAMARELIGGDNFFEVYVSTPLEVCEQRDVKGLYKKARSGLLPNMTGLHSPYEAPEHPDLALNAAELPIATAVQRILAADSRTASTG